VQRRTAPPNLKCEFDVLMRRIELRIVHGGVRRQRVRLEHDSPISLVVLPETTIAVSSVEFPMSSGSDRRVLVRPV
jgi:hypothetical protein